MEIATLISISFLAAALGIALGRYVWPTVRGTDREALAKAQTEFARLDQECTTLRSRTEQLDTEHKAAADAAQKAGEEVARLTERVVGLTKQIDEQEKQNSALEVQRDRAASEAKTLGAEVARLKERESALIERVEAQTVQLAEQQKQLTTEFENIANRILKANVTDLSENSQKALTAILDPLRERIRDFQQKVETTYEAESRDVLALKEQIKLVLETSHAVGDQADGLAKALRGDSQLLGRWGELALERILEAAGLTEGREYVSQGRGLGLKSEAEGAQRPDIIVMLPEKRTIIVDSKVPLTSYERLIAATDETERALCAKQVVKDMKGHIDGLSSKRYQENEKLQAHDAVLMFVPIEGALAAALMKDPELFVYAWDRHVVLVGPPTLLLTLKTVASIWRYELQGQNAQEIAHLAGDLCNKVSASLTELNSVATKITDALNAHNEAVKRLSTGKNNALSIGVRIRSLGVKTKNAMPSMLINGVSITPPIEDSEENISAETDAEANLELLGTTR